MSSFDFDMTSLKDATTVQLSRRSILKRAALAGLTVPGVITLLAACGGDSEEEEGSNSEASGTTSASPNSGSSDAGSDTGNGSDAADAGQKGGVLVIGRADDAESLDPIRSGAFASGDTMALIYDTLTVIDMDGSVQPNIAEGWDISSDGLEYTFTLREGITFHDGTPLDANAVKAHFDRTLDPASAGRSAGWLGSLTETTAADSTTVTFVMSSPFAPFLNTLAISAFGIPSPTAVEQHGENFGQNPVGSGPFKFKEWIPGDRIVLEKNPDYQCFVPYVENRGAPYLDGITFRVIPETQSLIASFQAGEIHLIQVPPQHVATFVGDDDYQTFSKETAGTLTNFVEFSLGKAPFDDLKVRQAFAHALDVPTIIDTVLEGQAQRNFCLMPVGLAGWTEQCEEWGYAYDVDASARLLDEAGWELKGNVREKDGEQLEAIFTTFSSEPFSSVAEIMQAQASAVGFNLSIQTFEVGTQLSAISQPEPESNLDLINWGWSTSHLLHMMTHSEQPLGRYESDDFSTVIEETLSETDPEKQTELYAEAQRILLEDCAAVPLYTDIYTYATPTSVRDFYLGPQIQSYLGVLVFQDTYIED